MTSKKELQIAKKMYKNSLTDGSVDSKKVKAILKEMTGQKLTHPKRVLVTYKRLIEAAIAKDQVVVESAAKIPNEKAFESQLKTKTRAKRVIYRINPKIIIGAKITHGDWIYDNTLDAKLAQLTNN